jgi:transposase
VQEPAPERPIDGGLATEALLAHVLVNKYADEAPRAATKICAVRTSPVIASMISTVCPA